MPATAPLHPSPKEHGRYLALKARDARFDGHFFFGVTSTGIYCRPVCRVRPPKEENCRFFTLASQAEAAGFRPCMRCRPELAPASPSTAHGPAWSVQDSSSILAQQAAMLLDTAQTWHAGRAARDRHDLSMGDVAQRLGVSERHMRRIFEAHWGVSPLQYLQTRRLLLAKQLLTDTQLPVAHIATLSGFGSVRRFNTVFAKQYQLQPRALRQSTPRTSTVQVQAAYRPPYNVAALLQFFAVRSVPGMEAVNTTESKLTRTLALDFAGKRHAGWVEAQFLPERCCVQLSLSDTLADALPAVLMALKHMLDLDADMQAIDPVLTPSFAHTEGMRLPGTVDGWELAVRAIIGQQITVRAAQTLLQRLVHQWGDTLTTAHKGLDRLFPAPERIAQACADALGQLGIVRQRQQALIALAREVADGRIALQPGVPVQATMDALQALPGIGPWTAQYIAMRALRWPDAFPAGDVALQKALGVRHHKNAALAAEEASHIWKPWRSYAVLRAWATTDNITPNATK